MCLIHVYLLPKTFYAYIPSIFNNVLLEYSFLLYNYIQCNTYVHKGWGLVLEWSCRSREFRATDTKMTSTFAHLKKKIKSIEEKKINNLIDAGKLWLFYLVLQTVR